MSDTDGETIYTDSDRSESSDSEGSIADFIDDDTPQRYVCSRAEICSSNIIQGKRKRVQESEEEEEEEEEETEEDSDSSSDYCPSE